MFPALVVNRDKLRENIRVITELCEANNVNFCAVTKCFRAEPAITEVYYNSGIRAFADSRVQNLKRIDYPGITKWLLRLPMLCEAEDTVLNADISLNSEIQTVEALSRYAVMHGRIHNVILMIDVGDLREGVLAEDAVSFAGEVIKYPGIELFGVGANFNCYGGIIPDLHNLSVVTRAAKDIEQAYNIKLSVISGGNSGSVHFLTNKNMPLGVNHLRLGEILFMGRETSYQRLVPGMNEDVFTLRAQIIELKKKPSKPIGTAGLNALGEKVEFADKGDMLRAIIACGRQDVHSDHLTPLDADIDILGQSSDHTILDVTRSKRKYNIGDAAEFGLSYASVLSLSTSEYVRVLMS